MRLEYDVTSSKAGDLSVYLYGVPTLDVTGKAALRVGLSIDERPMQTLTDWLVPATGDETSQAATDWRRAVQDNARVLQAVFAKVEPGKHVIKIWRIDDNVVVQKVVASIDPLPPSYLGPPETQP